MLNNIQVLRALAVLLVVYHHIPQAPFLGVPDPTQIGHLGVDIFFVISGFVMNYSITQRFIGPVRFWLLRLIRIAPAYWLITCVVFAIACVKPSWFSSVPTDIASLVKSLFFIPFPRANGMVQPVISVGWTLNYEMLFYVIFGFGLFLTTERQRLLMVTGVMAAFVACGIIFAPTNYLLKFYSDPIMLEFVAGMWVSWVLARLPPMSRVAQIWGGGLLLAAAACALLLIHREDILVYRVLYFGIPATAIVLGAAILQKQGLVINNRVLVGIGASSYSVYLTHAFAIRIAYQLLAHGYILPPLLSAVAFVLVTTVALITGWIGYQLIELPGNSFFKGHLQRVRLIPAGWLRRPNV